MASRRGHPLPPFHNQALVFSSLSARTLAIAGCVNKAWRSLAAEPADAWAGRYTALWQLPSAAPAYNDAAAWRRQYGARQLLSRCWLGRPATDRLAGHRSAAKACALLPHHGVLLTGGVDRLLVGWDLSSGKLLAASRRFAGTLRCIAADSRMLACGSSDHRIRVWLANSGPASGNQTAPIGTRGGWAAATLPFDLEGERAVLAGHAGPVTSVQLAADVLVSGSWDCTIRVWDRASLECIQLLHTDDWVGDLSLRGGTLAAACGREVLLFRLAGGALERVGSLASPRVGAGGGSAGGAHGAVAVTAVDCSADGRSLFLGTADGGVWATDLSSLLASAGQAGGRAGSGGGEQAPRPVLLQQQAAEVASLAWDHPWLAVADRSGAVMLLDCGAATAAGASAMDGGGTQGAAAASAASLGRGSSSRKRQLPAQQAPRAARVLHSAGMGGAGAGAGTQCVSLAGCWAAAGLDCGAVLTWDGAKGLQQQAAAAAARQAKAERRQRNQERHAAQQQHRGGAGGSGGGGFRRGSRGQTSATAAARPSCSASAGDNQGRGRSTGADTCGGEGRAGSGGGTAVQAAEPASAMQLSTQQPATVPRHHGGGRVRVPPPPRPEALAPGAEGTAGGSSCRQQAWQVLGRASGPSPARPAPAGGGTSPPG